MSIDYVALKSELDNDPTGQGYKTGSPAVFLSDSQLADKLNTPTTVKIFRAYTNTEDVIAGIVQSDWDSVAITTTQRSLLTMILSPSKIKSGDSNLRTTLANIFPAGSQTRTNMIDVVKKFGSRVEILFGEGSRVSDVDVALALRPPV